MECKCCGAPFEKDEDTCSYCKQVKYTNSSSGNDITSLIKKNIHRFSLKQLIALHKIVS